MRLIRGRKVILDLRDPKVSQDQLVHKDRKETVVCAVKKVKPVRLARRVLREILVQLVRKALVVKKVNVVLMVFKVEMVRRVQKVIKEILAQLDLRDRRVFPENLDLSARLAQKEILDHKAHKVSEVKLDLSVILAQKDRKDQKVIPVFTLDLTSRPMRFCGLMN